MTFGEKIYYELKARGWTTAELIRRAQFTRGTHNYWASYLCRMQVGHIIEPEEGQPYLPGSKPSKVCQDGICRAFGWNRGQLWKGVDR